MGGTGFALGWFHVSSTWLLCRTAQLGLNKWYFYNSKMVYCSESSLPTLHTVAIYLSASESMPARVCGLSGGNICIALICMTGMRRPVRRAAWHDSWTGLPNRLLTKLTGKEETFTDGNFWRLQAYLQEQHPERFGCGKLGACAGNGEKEL